MAEKKTPAVSPATESAADPKTRKTAAKAPARRGRPLKAGDLTKFAEADARLTAAARRRTARIQEELPTVLEFLALCLSAGEGLLDSLRRVGAVGAGELTGEVRAVVIAAGIDPIYFGVLFVINNAIGLITPPVGTTLNVICGVAKVKMDEVIVGVAPFLIAELVVLFLLVMFPGLVMGPLRWFM